MSLYAWCSEYQSIKFCIPSGRSAFVHSCTSGRIFPVMRLVSVSVEKMQCDVVLFLGWIRQNDLRHNGFTKGRQQMGAEGAQSVRFQQYFRGIKVSHTIHGALWEISQPPQYRKHRSSNQLHAAQEHGGPTPSSFDLQEFLIGKAPAPSAARSRKGPSPHSFTVDLPATAGAQHAPCCGKGVPNAK